jgi:ATP-dependent RNA helicase DeaD
MPLPTREDVADRRAAQFKDRITEVLGSQDLAFFDALVASYAAEHGKEPREVAAALAFLAQKDRPLVPSGPAPRRDEERREAREGRERSGEPRERRERHERPARPESPPRERSFGPRPDDGDIPRGAVRYRIEVGHEHGVKPANIVGAIANEAGIDAQHIGRVRIFDQHSTVELPEGMPKDVYHRLRKAWVCGQQLSMSVDSGSVGPRRPPPGMKPKRKKTKT